MTLQDYGFEIIHVPGKTVTIPDALSRRSDYDDGKHNNEDKILLPDYLFVQTSTINLEDIHNQILMCKDQDTEVSTAITLLLEEGLQSIKKDLLDWKIWEGLIRRKGKVYVPRDDSIWRDIVKLHHDTLPHGHRGEFATMYAVQQQYWWPGMTRFIKAYIQGCAVCQVMKHQSNKLKVLIHPIPTEHTLLFKRVTVDFIMDLPKSQGYDAVVIFMDHDSSKGAIFVPCHKMTSAEDLADTYIDHVWRWFGIPEETIMDRGKQFESKFMWELCT